MAAWHHRTSYRWQSQSVPGCSRWTGWGSQKYSIPPEGSAWRELCCRTWPRGSLGSPLAFFPQRSGPLAAGWISSGRLHDGTDGKSAGFLKPEMCRIILSTPRTLKLQESMGHGNQPSTLDYRRRANFTSIRHPWTSGTINLWSGNKFICFGLPMSTHPMAGTQEGWLANLNFLV